PANGTGGRAVASNAAVPGNATAAPAPENQSGATAAAGAENGSALGANSRPNGSANASAPPAANHADAGDSGPAGRADAGVPSISISNDSNLSLYDRFPYEWWSGPNDSNRTRARLGPGNASAGNATALMLEFVDYGCIHCGLARNETAQALAKYPNLALEWRHFPLPQLAYSRPEALGAECAADQGKFWEYSNAVMDDPMNVDFDKEYRLANASGVANLTLWAVCTKSQWHAGVLDADFNESKRYGVNATPTFVLNGQVFVDTGLPAQFLDFVGRAMNATAAKAG
ncbi:MAG: thioredoxin domain-containing protein, partial [Candidatus Micrarchaeota archaeon]|nr:thioredoxin domain-containing protein [Candidatus Micrarchaeota archaeon]